MCKGPKPQGRAKDNWHISIHDAPKSKGSSVEVLTGHHVTWTHSEAHSWFWSETDINWDQKHQPTSTKFGIFLWLRLHWECSGCDASLMCASKAFDQDLGRHWQFPEACCFTTSVFAHQTASAFKNLIWTRASELPSCDAMKHEQ